MLGKLGIQPEVENIGKYKSFGDMIKNSAMSEAQREEMTDMMDQAVQRFTGMVARFRKKISPDCAAGA